MNSKENLKPKTRTRRGSFGLGKKQAITTAENGGSTSQHHEVEPPDSPEGRKSKMGALRDSFRESGSAMKESIKRPLSSILRRPGSRSGSRDRSSKAREREGPETIELPIEDTDPSPRMSSRLPEKKQSNWDDDIPARPASSAGARRPMTSGGFGRRPGSSAGFRPPPPSSDGLLELNDDRSDSPDIPNLEEMQSNEFGTLGIAQAPSIAVNKVSSYKELNNELQKHAAFATLDNEIDLSILAKALCPENDVKEEDTVWTWDFLFTHVSSHLRHDWDEANKMQKAYDQPIPTAGRKEN